MTLGTREDALRKALGPPAQVNRGFLSYCVQGGGRLMIGEPNDRSGTFGAGGRAPAVIVLTTSHRFVLHGRHAHLVTVGSASKWLPRAHRLGRVHGTTVVRAGNLIAGIRHRRIAFLGVYNRRALRTTRALRTRLGRAL